MFDDGVDHVDAGSTFVGELAPQTPNQTAQTPQTNQTGQSQTSPEGGPNDTRDDQPAPTGFEKTEILKAAPEAQEDYPVLELQMPDGNTSQVEVVGERFIIGRAPDSDMVINDSLVSRHHAVIEKRPDGFFLVDQNSGNGTLLNDQSITQELLVDGDALQIGDAIVTYFAPASAADQAQRLEATRMLPAAEQTEEPVASEPQPESPPRLKIPQIKHKRVLIVAAIVGGLFGIMAIVKLATKAPQPTGPDPQTLRQQQLAQAQRAAQESFESIKTLVKQGKWAQALPQIKEVAQALADNELVQEYKATIIKENEAQGILEKTQSLMAQQDYEGALTILNQMPKNSLQDNAAIELKNQIQDKHFSKLLSQARLALAEKNFEQAFSHSEALIRAKPDSDTAKSLRDDAKKTFINEKITKAKAAIGKRRYTDANTLIDEILARFRDDPSALRLRKEIQRKQGRTQQPRRATASKPKFLLRGRCLKLYRQTKLDEALSQSSSSGISAEAVKTLKRFQSFYQNGLEQSQHQGQLARAIKFLNKAYELDKQLGGGKGEITDKLRAKLAHVYFIQGVDAHQRKKYPLAFSSLTQAVHFKPSLKPAKKRLKDLELEAKKKWETAYIIKSASPNKAIDHCETVTKMVDPSSIYYGKCKKLIGKLRDTGVSGSSGINDDGF